MIFFNLVLAFGMLTAAYWYLAADYIGNAATAIKFVKVSSLIAPSSEIWRAQLLTAYVYYAGRRSFRLRHLHVRLVDLLCHHS